MTLPDPLADRSTAPPSDAPNRRREPAELARRYAHVRAQTHALTRTLQTEDFVVSSMADVSPTKWHLAHTSWFFETFVLSPHLESYRPINPKYSFLFNSYYVQAGERHCRAQRGLLTRPTVAEVFAYRSHVDEGMQALFREMGDDAAHPALQLIELGLHHEQQHQELLLTDIKHVYWMNPMRPAFAAAASRVTESTPEIQWVKYDGGVHRIGHDHPDQFSFDNEGPAHRVYVEPFRLANRLMTNGEYVAFVEDGGYRRPDLWLSSGWAAVQAQQWQAPLYWELTSSGWTEFTMSGMGPLDLAAPVCHVSYFEADAFARWSGARLPSEAEWEIAAASVPVTGPFVEGASFHPLAVTAATPGAMHQLYGDAWQWTQSPYIAYPGFSPAPGAIGEYNGKFMCDQWVLRGASCATSQSHARPTYRNFFPADTRWQFAGIRLAGQQ